MLVKISVLAAAGVVAVWAKAGEMNVAKLSSLRISKGDKKILIAGFPLRHGA
jgi:hypothetical protein